MDDKALARSSYTLLNRAFTIFLHSSRAVLLILALFILLTACQAAPAQIETPQPPAPETPVPTPTATPVALGSTGNPLVIGFVSENGDPEALTASRELAVQTTVQTGYAVQSKMFPSYPELVKAMKNGGVHFAWLPPLTYLYANHEKFADVGLLTNHYGTFFYGTQYLTNVDSGLTVYFDPNTNENTADAQTALQQLSGKSPCWVDYSSISGYILPAGILDEINVPIEQGSVMQTSTALIRALYIKGVCDFGATFAHTGDPRTAANVQQDLPDAVDRVVIIWRSDPIIPNMNLSTLPGLPVEVREAIFTHLMNMVKTDEGKQLLSKAASYDIQDLRVVDDSVYDPIRGAVSRTQTNLADRIGK